ncbi:MAG: riboflavin kinase [Bacteroidales bacterium]|nr:riboflavin kinase [Bacteroidales bacterium]
MACDSTSEWHHGIVIHGHHNGTAFGFPTANLLMLDMPETGFEKGVYAVWVRVVHQVFGGMMYIGTRPTLSLTALSIEIHLFDFHQNLYGQDISFLIVGKVRDEQRFGDAEALIQQLARDKEAVLAMLHELSEETDGE